MKRYIRASFDSSMPSWLKGEFARTKLGDVFVKKYGLALSDIEFLDEPTADSIKIYNLVGDNGYTKVYIPGVNEDDEILLNGRWRKLGGIAKSKLDGLTHDIAYIDRSSSTAKRIASVVTIPGEADTSLIIDMWYGDKFEPKKYGADASFYGNDGEYRGNIYDETDKIIGNYTSDNSVLIQDNFLIDFGD